MKAINPHNSNAFGYSLVTFLIVLIVFLGGLFYVKPLLDDVGKVAQARDKMQVQKETLTKQLEELQKIQNTFDQSSEVSKQISLNAVPERFDEDKLIVELTQMTQKNDVVLNSISFGVTGTSTEKIKRVAINANITGSLSGFQGFLKSLEGAERKIVVKSVTVQTSQADSDTSRAMPANRQANFNISAETYYRDRL